MLSRQEYVAQRVNGRMRTRGEPMLLRRVSLLPGPEPFKNPPDVSAVALTAGSQTAGQYYIGLTGITLVGRLVPGDIVTVGAHAMTVVAMPANVMTDADGIPIVDGGGDPTFGTPPVYNADSLAWDNVLPVVPVTSSIDPSLLIGQAAGFTFQADAAVYGNPMSLYQRTALGWTEIDDLTINIAAYGVAPPKVNDLLILTLEGNQRRAVVDVSTRYSNGQNFLYSVRAH